ncbi:MAG: hypothetical protein GY827_04795 [Cytophagales bacterium]|nr:hypothetical protein [Cytophagales bacterium]
MNITAKNERQKMNIEWLLKNDNATYESLDEGRVQVVRYDTKNQQPVAAIFRDNRKDPREHYRYATIERREEAIQNQVNASKTYHQAKIDRKKNKKNANIKVGDILVTSWGYDQTNVDFYQVTKLIGKATVEYVQIGSETVEETSWCSADVKANPKVIVNSIPERGRINPYGVKIGRETGRITTTDDTHYRSWGY